MHWFGEVMAFSALLILAVGIPAEVRWVRLLNVRLKAARHDFVTRAAWQRTWRLLNDANASAIAAIEAGLAPGFPEEIRDQMLAAHSAAGEVMRGTTAYEER